MDAFWSSLPPTEVERRRNLSIDAMREIERSKFSQWYQEKCDSTYWQNGQCCAGCDFWNSDMGDMGECRRAGVVSGAEVLRSLGFTFSSYTPAPGFPFTRNTGWCGNFRDDFDWLTLDDLYLRRIGAICNDHLKAKPKHSIDQMESADV